MNGNQKVAVVRSQKEEVNWNEVFRELMSRVTNPGEAFASLSSDSREIFLELIKSHADHSTKALDFFFERVGEREKQLRLRKIFGFASSAKLQEDAWRSAYEEYQLLSSKITADHIEFAQRVISAHSMMVMTALQALQGAAGQQLGMLKLGFPGGNEQQSQDT
jgi:hypothetical protein